MGDLVEAVEKVRISIKGVTSLLLKTLQHEPQARQKERLARTVSTNRQGYWPYLNGIPLSEVAEIGELNFAHRSHQRENSTPP